MSATLETPKMKTSHTPKGQGTDHELLEVISRRPGLSKYELARAVGWSMGKTDGGITRLLKQQLVYLMVLERDGRRVNLIYPSGYVKPDYISINAENVPPGIVNAVVYALTSTTIGVTWGRNEDWEKIAFRSASVPLKASGGDVIFRLPDDFRWFYRLDHRHCVVSINEGVVLITVSGEIRKA